MRNKSEEALQQIMEQYGNYLYRICFLLLKDQQMAEEMVQDTFVIAYTKVGQLRDSSKLKSWLTQIALNQCRVQMRRKTWRWLLPFPIEEVITKQQLEEQLAAATETIFLQQWRIEQLVAAIQQLDYKYREVITLYYYGQFSIEEIVEQMRINPNTVKARLARGRIKLRQRMEEAEIDG